MPTHLPILHETSDWLAINKPGGLIVENNPFESPTVESLVYDYLSHVQKNPFLGIVHRLDRVTSGVLVLAKKKSALRQLNEQFAQREVRKAYLAVVANDPKKSMGFLQHWLLKDIKNKKAIVFDQPEKGAQSVQLRYRVLDQEGGKILLEIQPLTGKFHQIRAQLSAIGCPIVGDSKYGGGPMEKTNTIALHAWKLQLTDPLDHTALEIIAPPPKDQPWTTFDPTLWRKS